jgi:integrase/recombinase XerD
LIPFRIDRVGYTRVSDGLIRRTQSPLDRLTLEVVPPA